MPTKTSLSLKLMRLQVLLAEFGVVLGPFDGPGQRGRAAGDDADHLARRGVEGRRAFGGVEHAEPAGRAGPAVDQPAARPRSRSAMSSIACAIASACEPTASTARPSSRFIRRTISSGVSSSRFAEAGLWASVCRWSSDIWRPRRR